MMFENSLYEKILPGFTVGKINCGNYKVRYVEAGTGEPLVFLHNGGADLSVWREQLKFFSRNHRVIAIDFLGFGESDKPPQIYDLELYFNALYSALIELKIDRPILIGNCVGGSTAIEYALRYPTHIKKLVLCSICGGAGFIPALNLLRFIPGLTFFYPWLSVQKFVLSAKAMFTSLGENELRSHYEEVIFKRKDLRLSRTRTLRGILSFSKFGRPLNLPKSFPETMIVWGTENKIMNHKYAELTKLQLKAKILKSIKGGGYLCFYENSEEFNQSVLSFINS